MKNSINLLILLFSISLTTTAQIREVERAKFEEVGKVGTIPFISSMKVLKDTAKGGTNSYLWMYNNLEFTTISDIKGISFSASEEDFNSLYDMMKTLVTSEKGTEKELMLGKSSISFKTIRSLGVSSLTIYDLSGTGYFYLTSKQIDKLFGK